MNEPLVLDPNNVVALAPEVFRRVWRTSIAAPGFALVRLSRAVISHELRRAMVELVAALPVPFVPERFGRFDQQVSSRFHRDGAPPASLLVLAYEPTTVRSRFWIADASAAAHAAGVSLAEYLKAHNPMFPAGEAALAPFVTELPLPHGESFLILANNSLLPFDGANPLGVLHKAVIEEPDPAARRVINSIGYAVNAPGLPRADLERFLSRSDLD